MVGLFIFVASVLFLLLIAGLRRKYNSASLINGFMDIEKAKELAPEIFDRKKTNTVSKTKKKPRCK